MLSLFFDTSFWYDVLLVIAILAVIYILIKFPHAKVYVFSILFSLIFISGIYSIININSYYSATGGIYGVLSGTFGNNNQLHVNEKTFELKNTTLTQVNGDKYSAKSVSQDVFKVDSDKYLGVFVNGSPCTYSKIEEDYFVAYYSYNFYGRDNEILFNDTLKMYFAFYENSTQLEVITEGGSKAVAYWGYYFNNNNFNVTLKSVNAQYNKELTFGEGDVSNYAVVKYYLNNDEIAKQVYLKGTKIDFPIINSNKIYKWKLKDSDNYINSSYVVTDNLLIDVEESELSWTTIYQGSLNTWVANYSADLPVKSLTPNSDFRLTIDYVSMTPLAGSSFYVLPDGSTCSAKSQITQPWVITAGETCRYTYEDKWAQFEFSCVENDVLHISLVSNSGMSIVQGDMQISKVEVLSGEPLDDYTLTIIPRDSDSTDCISFSVESIVLTNVSRALTFSFTIKEGYSLGDYAMLSDGLFAFDVDILTSGKETGVACVYLTEDLARTVEDTYYFNFYITET